MEDQIWFHKYKVLKKIGQGGSSEVFLAEHIKLKSLRAIKRISKNNILHEQLLKEAHILKDLKHSCIPVIYDFEEDAHNSYIIEQYIEGHSLKVLLKQKRHLPENLIIHYAIQICELLQYLYSLNKPILYLDLNPENIIVQDNTIKLIDFGAASYKFQLNNRKYSLGTKGFAAPELYSRVLPDERTDIYGIGTLLFYMETGNSFSQSSEIVLGKEYARYFSSDLQKIMKRCLQYYPALRYSSVTVLKNKLLELCKDNKTICNSSCKSTCVAVAGTQSRVGTTHLSFLITSYFESIGTKSLYIEKNNSNHVLKIIRRNNQQTKNGIYKISGCNMLPAYNIELPYSKAEYIATILDYGCLSKENIEEFLKADLKFIVSGAKDWELEETEMVLKLLDDSSGTKFLYNFTESKHFKRIAGQMKNEECYRVPYEPNPFQFRYNVAVVDFLNNIIPY